MKLKNTFLLVMLGLMLGVLTGCLVFERQTMTWRHDSASDTLWIFQDYQGIFGDEDPAALSDNEIEQLDSVIQGGRTFFFNNWITEYNRDRLKEILEMPRGEIEDDPDYETAIRDLARVALANVKVENVGFYYNADKRLCGAQQITIQNVSKVVAALNKTLLFVLRDQAEDEGKSAEYKRLMLKFADSRKDMLRFDGNRLELQMPLSTEDFIEARDRSTQGAAFRRSGGVMKHEDGVLTVSIGSKDAKSGSLMMPFVDKPYSDNTVVRAKGQGIKDSFDPVAAARAFLKLEE